MTTRKTVHKVTGVTENANDADDSRSLESPDAQKVRDGEVSAAQIGGNNIPGTDIQVPPGIIETAASVRGRAAGEAAKK